MKRDALLIGSFAIAAFIASIVAVLWLGGSNFFRTQIKARVYYEGNVNGLSAGAPVTFRGVHVGEVTSVRILMDTTTLKATIPVSLSLQGTALDFQDGGVGRPVDLRSLVQRGLRARLAMQSVVTGQKMIELDFMPDTPATLVGAADEQEIPAVRDRFDALIQQLAELPLRDTVAEVRGTIGEMRTALVSVQHTLDGAQTAINSVSGELRSTGEQSRKTLAAASDAIGRVQGSSTAALDAIRSLADASRQTVLAVQPELQRTLVGTRQAAETATVTIDRIADLIAPGAPMREDLTTTITDLSQAVRSLRSLSEQLEDKPNAILFGSKRE
jgi:paraquat-inducible protein B